MVHQGSCHCGRIKFRVEGNIGGVISCNCSICQRKGALMWFVPRAQLQLLTPEADASTYSFNKHRHPAPLLPGSAACIPMARAATARATRWRRSTSAAWTN
jgi:hypothetical protein